MCGLFISSTCEIIHYKRTMKNELMNMQLTLGLIVLSLIVLRCGIFVKIEKVFLYFINVLHFFNSVLKEFSIYEKWTSGKSIDENNSNNIKSNHTWNYEFIWLKTKSYGQIQEITKNFYTNLTNEISHID